MKYQKTYFIHYPIDSIHSLPVSVYLAKGKRRLSGMMSFGLITVYAPYYINEKEIYYFLSKFIKKNQDKVLYRPYYQENVFLYVFGKKLSLVPLSENRYLYSKRYSSPLKALQGDFRKYLAVRVVEIGKEYGLDLSETRVVLTEKKTYLGQCKKYKDRFILRFDWRLAIYEKELIDAVIYHEITHILEMNHSKRFYHLLTSHLPDYEYRMKLIQGNYYGGREDEYLTGHH